MSREERLSRMASAYGGRILKHFKVASDVLDRLGKELHKRELGYLDDEDYLFHILVPDGKGRFISLFCGGLSRAIDIQMLKKDGSPDRRSKEAGFMTPIGAANFIERKYA